MRDTFHEMRVLCRLSFLMLFTLNMEEATLENMSDKVRATRSRIPYGVRCKMFCLVLCILPTARDISLPPLPVLAGGDVLGKCAREFFVEFLIIFRLPEENIFVFGRSRPGVSVRFDFLFKFFAQGRVLCHLRNINLLFGIFLRLFFGKDRWRTGPNHRADNAYLKESYPIFLHR